VATTVVESPTAARPAEMATAEVVTTTSAIGVPSVAPVAVDADGYSLLHDFGPRDAWRTPSASTEESAALVARFPHPHAKGATCGLNYPTTPVKDRAQGTLLPRVTVVRGAFSRAGAEQSAFLVDYCPTGDRVPSTRRLLVLENDKLVVDHELGRAEVGDEVLLSIDVTKDGLAELLLLATLYRPGTSSLTVATLMQIAPGKPRVLGRWDAIDHCSVLKNPDETTTHEISFRPDETAPSFRDKATTERCFYPPPPPR
jgi:hypothetical protein